MMFSTCASSASPLATPQILGQWTKTLDENRARAADAALAAYLRALPDGLVAALAQAA
jgi:hypothetical protein